MRNQLLMQIYADVTRRPLSLVASEQGPALGSAIHAAVAAGAYPDIAAAAAAMGKLHARRLQARPGQRGRLRSAVRRVRGAARLFRARHQRGHAPAPGAARPGTRPAGRRGQPAMRPRTDRPPSQRNSRPAAGPRRTSAALHAELVRNGLVAWTSGNISARVPGDGPAGDQAKRRCLRRPHRRSMVVCDLSGARVGGELSPSSDTASHAYIYRQMPEVGGVVHTHSRYATAWAARGEPIPCVLTAMADEFGGEIPIGPFALDRRRGDRPRDGRDAVGSPLTGRADAQPRRVHRGRHRARRGEGGGDVRGRGVHGPSGQRLGELTRCRPTRSTPCTGDTRTSTASADRLAPNPALPNPQGGCDE